MHETIIEEISSEQKFSLRLYVNFTFFKTFWKKWKGERRNIQITRRKTKTVCETMTTSYYPEVINLKVYASVLKTDNNIC